MEEKEDGDNDVDYNAFMPNGRVYLEDKPAENWAAVFASDLLQGVDFRIAVAAQNDTEAKRINNVSR